ncbi:MAG: cysteine desulfurase NifS [Clostridia bacterium]|nr:cysteine desulfurase NifS [Clostridia bacterium]
MNKIYMDNAATTRVTEPVLEEMAPYFTQFYGNPSSVHAFGRDARKGLDQARSRVAKALGARPEEIYFTAGGSESDNWAIKGAAHALKEKGRHLITTSIEHHAVLHTMQALAKEGFEITYLPVDADGLVSVEQVEKALREDTILVSIMMANNEIGTIEPIAEIGELLSSRHILFHTDAVQAVGHIPIDVQSMHIDLLSLSGHKFHSPKGVGALYIRKGLRIANLIDGGQQERSRRAGTENIPSIVGMGKAIELAVENMEENNKYLITLRDRLISGLLEKIDYIRLNGHPTKRLPGNVNVSIRFVEGESLLLSLDMKGIAGSSGSACTSGSLDPSHVLLGIGLEHEIAHGSLRLTLDTENTMEEVETVLEVLPQIVERLRSMSPLYENFIREQKAKS